jgi:superfamily II DNA/RNA helicase
MSRTGSGAKRPSFSRSGATGGSRFQGGIRSRGGKTGGNRRKEHIDFTQFVKKAIKVEETKPYDPKHLFTDFTIHEKLKANIVARDYLHPTPIQDGAIPHIINGRDVIGIANTGTGKTAAFLIPLINKAFHKKKTERILIVVPTRELATQIDDEFRDFSKGSGLRSAIVIGGASIRQQARDLAAFPSFVIGTPGRLKDVQERGMLDLSKFNNVVLDEVDRMLDMGFVKDIKFLIDILMPQRQSLFFSATMPREIMELSQKFLNDPVRIEVKTRATAENVDQDIVRLKPGEDKIERLHDILNQPECKKVLIFGRTKHGVEKLAINLERRGFKSDAIHGDKTQGKRERALKNFRDDKITILVATDVAARGLDIPDVTHVINYEVPETYDDYVHRIGRTGRGNKSGIALTFVD